MCPGREFTRCDAPIEAVGDGVCRTAQRFHHAGIPVSVEIGVVAVRGGRQADTVAAAVVVVGDMKRLMKITDQMHQELQRHQPIRGSGRRRLKLGLELRDLVDDAVLCATGARNSTGIRRREARAGRFEVRMIDLDIDVVPSRRFAMAVAVLIRPGGAAGKVRRSQGIGVAGQHGIDLDLRGGCQMAVGDECRDLVAKVTPGVRRIRCGQQRVRGKEGRYRFHHHGTVRPR